MYLAVFSQMHPTYKVGIEIYFYLSECYEIHNWLLTFCLYLRPGGGGRGRLRTSTIHVPTQYFQIHNETLSLSDISLTLGNSFHSLLIGRRKKHNKKNVKRKSSIKLTIYVINSSLLNCYMQYAFVTLVFFIFYLLSYILQYYNSFLFVFLSVYSCYL